MRYKYLPVALTLFSSFLLLSACGGGGGESEPTINITIDTSPPSVPTGLSSTPINCTRVDLTWNSSTDTGGSGLAVYRIYRDGTQVATSATASNSDTGLSENTTYT